MPYRVPPDHTCTLPEVAFDAAAAVAGKLASDEVRRRWPRVYYACPVCGVTTTVYASMAHYVWGDW